jgi:hypothetical protein
MIKQNIVIINFNSLYEILEEIKENLFFKIINYKSLEDFIKDNKVNKKNTLIISNLNHELSLNNNLYKKNFLNLKDLPLPLSKLIELINIRLIKLRFNQQSKINIQGFELNLNSKFISINNLTLKLTEKEIEIILYLNSKKEKKNVQDLQKNIWGYSSNLETHTVETHIYRLRKKISDKFNNKNFIMSDNGGYFIE